MSQGYCLAIVHYNDSDAVNRLVASSRSWSARPAAIVVIDNSDNFPPDRLGQISIVATGQNVGYGAAANMALAWATDRGFPSMLLCTQDAGLQPNAAEKLLSTLRSDPKIGIAAPVLSYSTQPTVIFSAGGTLSRRGVAIHPDQGRPLSEVSSVIGDVDWVDGAITMLNTEVGRTVGGFEPRFFLYVEEVEFQYRLRLAGYSIRVVSSALGEQEPGNYLDYLRYRNHVWMTHRHSELRSWPWMRMALRDCLKHILRRKRFDLRAALQGVVDAYNDRMGDPSRAQS